MVRRAQPVGAGHQFAGTFRTVVAGMQLGDRLVETDAQTGLLQGADQPQADRGQTDTETGGGDEKGMHVDSLAFQFGSRSRVSRAICRSSLVGTTSIRGWPSA